MAVRVIEQSPAFFVGHLKTLFKLLFRSYIQPFSLHIFCDMYINLGGFLFLLILRIIIMTFIRPF